MGTTQGEKTREEARMDGEISFTVAELEREIEDLQAEIEEHKEAILRLEAEQNVLRRLRNRAVHAHEPEQEEGVEIPYFEPDYDRPIPRDEWPDEDVPTPSEAVDRLVHQYPGIRKKTFADVATERGLESEARDPRNVLLTALRRRVRDEKVWEDPKSRLWPWDHEKAQQLRQALDEAEHGEFTMQLRDRGLKKGGSA